MQHIIVDIEANGPVPPMYSMIALGAVHHQSGETFYSDLAPISSRHLPEALAVAGVSYEETLRYPDPADVMIRFNQWVRQMKGDDRVMFVSDTTSFDFAFVNYYLWWYCGENPFGHAPLSLTNLYKGLTGDYRARIHHLRDTEHTHNALDDARGNAEAFAKIDTKMRLRKVTTKKQFLTT